MLKRIRAYFHGRLTHTMVLWAGIWLAAYALPVVSALWEKRDANKARVLDLEPFMDWNLLLVLACGFMFVVLLMSALDAIGLFNETQQRRGRTLVQRCADEVSSASTHLACAAFVAAVALPGATVGTWVAVAAGLLLGALLFKPGDACGSGGSPDVQPQDDQPPGVA